MLNIKNLAFSYSGNRDVVAVSELNVSNRGLYSIIGMNGAGKTTLLKIIAGILKYRGSCTLQNREVNTLNAASLSQMRSYIPQSQAFSFDFTVNQFVRFGLYRQMNIFSLLERKHEEEARRIMESLDICSIAEHSLNNISGGELQKAHIARALLQNAPVMLLDEPVSNIDIHYKFQIMKLLREEAKQRMVFYVTHDINTALNYSDMIIAMKNGSIISFMDNHDTVKHFEQIYDRRFRIRDIEGHYILIDEEIE